jgi:hypothetical protein
MYRPILKAVPSREVNGHRVYGKLSFVDAPTEPAARQVALSQLGGGWQVWEARELAEGRWECFVSKYEDAFALND